MEVHEIVMNPLPPHSLVDEQGLLGCILQQPDLLIEAETAGIKLESFYDVRHRAVFTACCDLTDAGMPVDLIAVQRHLSAHQLLDGVGGIPYLSSLLDACASTAHWRYYAEILIEKAKLRSVIQVAAQVIASAMASGAHQETAEAMQERLQEAVRKDAVPHSDPSQHIRPILETVIGKIEEYHERHGQLLGVTWGFDRLNELTGGMMPAETYVIAARPGCGKTTALLNICRAAAGTNVRSLIFSLEMTADALGLRLLCSESRINSQSIRHGTLTERDYSLLATATARLSSLPITVDDSPSLTIRQIRARVLRHQPQLVAVDYLQLIRSHERKPRQEIVADISAGLKAIAKEANVPIIILAQLNRDAANERPGLHHLRESGSLEADHDFVGLLSHPEPKKGQEDDPSHVIMDVAKQRNGPVGVVHFTFLREFVLFESRQRTVDPQDVPRQCNTPYRD